MKPTELMTDEDWQDDAEWADGAWVLPARPSGGEESFVVRVPSQDLDEIERAAERSGVTPAEWIAEAARQRLRRRRTA